MDKTPRNGRSDNGYLLNCTFIGRGPEIPVFDVSDDGIVPYMDRYIVMPIEEYERRIEEARFQQAEDDGALVDIQFPFTT